LYSKVPSAIVDVVSVVLDINRIRLIEVTDSPRFS
jgi:hypothetical protein